MEIVFDCRQASVVARFWAAVLDDYEVGVGAIVHQETPNWTTMLDPGGNEFCVVGP